LSTAASAEGPRPKRMATPTTPSRNSITMLASSSTPASGVQTQREHHAGGRGPGVAGPVKRRILVIGAVGERCSTDARDNRRELSARPTSRCRVQARAPPGHATGAGIAGHQRRQPSTGSDRPSTSVAQLSRSRLVGQLLRHIGTGEHRGGGAQFLGQLEHREDAVALGAASRCSRASRHTRHASAH
jgi:hypothetical protein